MRAVRGVACGLWVLVVGAAIAADTKVDNPDYASWAKVKVGTVVTLTEVATFFNDKKLTYTHTYTLKELKDDEARVEHKQFLDGKEATDFTVTYPVRRQKPLPEGGKKEDALMPKPGAVAGGDEKVKIGGKEYAAKKFTTTEKEAGGYTVTTTYWLCDDVPGRVIKKDVEKKADQGTFKETSRFVLADVKAP